MFPRNTTLQVSDVNILLDEDIYGNVISTFVVARFTRKWLLTRDVNCVKSMDVEHSVVLEHILCADRLRFDQTTSFLMW